MFWRNDAMHTWALGVPPSKGMGDTSRSLVWAAEQGTAGWLSRGEAFTGPLVLGDGSLVRTHLNSCLIGSLAASGTATDGQNGAHKAGAPGSIQFRVERGSSASRTFLPAPSGLQRRQ